MRHSFTWISLILMILFSFSCEHDFDSGQDFPAKIDMTPSKPFSFQPTVPVTSQKSNNNLVVKFRSTVVDSAKKNTRDSYHVKTYRRCNCGDDSIELWEFDQDSLGQGGVEEIKTEVDTDPDLESTDFQYTFSMDLNSQLTTASNFYASKIKPVNEGITVAIIDSGIDPSIPNVKGPYLYNNLLSRTCDKTSRSGWDFVEDDEFPQDLHGHGSSVSAIIAEYLSAQDVNFQILPIRAFDENGVGSHFQISCALQFAINNYDVDVINLSFGWYANNLEIIDGLIQSPNNDKVIITSAGNHGINNDVYPHYPSGYNSSGIIAVGAHNESITGMAPYSNFGGNTVDIVAPGSFFLGNYTGTPVVGTSFSAAFTSAKSAEILFADAISNHPMIQRLILQSTFNAELDLSNKVKYPYTINP